MGRNFFQYKIYAANPREAYENLREKEIQRGAAYKNGYSGTIYEVESCQEVRFRPKTSKTAKPVSEQIQDLINQIRENNIPGVNSNNSAVYFRTGKTSVLKKRVPIRVKEVRDNYPKKPIKWKTQYILADEWGNSLDFSLFAKDHEIPRKDIIFSTKSEANNKAKEFVLKIGIPVQVLVQKVVEDGSNKGKMFEPVFKLVDITLYEYIFCGNARN